jgi:hypothetical protein
LTKIVGRVIDLDDDGPGGPLHPVKLRRAIVVLMSGQGRAVRDITSLMQVSADYLRDVIHAFNRPPTAAWSAWIWPLGRSTTGSGAGNVTASSPFCTSEVPAGPLAWGEVVCRLR